jgi:signal transduction histidine kinase
MSSMRERAAEIGGDLTVETSSDGTVVCAVLPLESA